MEAYEDDLARIVAELNRSAPGGAPAARPAQAPEHTTASENSLDGLLGWAARQHASDLLLIAGTPIALRVNGALSAGSGDPLQPEDVRNLMLPLLTPEQYAELRKNRSVDFCFIRDNLGRFRTNIHFQRGTVAASIRLLPERIPTLASLNLPPTLAKLTERRQGLVLVTGPTGCGKSSTLAALIDLINTNKRCHIVTIEDPVEYHHSNKRSIVEQIEVGRDTPDFLNSVRSILRQTPDVILVGEMRDAETMATVLTAAETGHLVFSTLHTNDTAQAVSRILDSFPTAHQQQMRQQLSLALAAVIAQQLVPAPDGVNRYPALEVMMATDAIRNLIRRGEDHQLRTHVGTGRADGMMTMEQSLAELVRVGRIDSQTAHAHCFRPDDLREYLHY